MLGVGVKWISHFFRVTIFFPAAEPRLRTHCSKNFPRFRELTVAETKPGKEVHLVYKLYVGKAFQPLPKQIHMFQRQFLTFQDTQYTFFLINIARTPPVTDRSTIDKINSILLHTTGSFRQINNCRRKYNSSPSPEVPGLRSILYLVPALAYFTYLHSTSRITQ